MKKKKNNIELFVFVKMIITMVVLVLVVLGIISYVLRGNEKINNKVSVKVGSIEQLDIYKMEDAINTLTPTIVTVINDTDTISSYELYITIDKKSNIDFKYLRVYFDEELYDLSNMRYFDDGNKYYFEVLRGNIKANHQEEHKTIMWLDESYDGGRDNKSIIVGFDTII